MSRARMYLTDEEKQQLIALEAQRVSRYEMSRITKVNPKRIRDFLGVREIPLGKKKLFEKTTVVEKEKRLIAKNIEAQKLYDQIQLNDIIKVTVITKKVTRNYKCQVIGVYQHYKLLQNLKRKVHKICLKVCDLVSGSTGITVIEKA